MIFVFLCLTYCTQYDNTQANPCCCKWHYFNFFFFKAESHLNLYKTKLMRREHMGRWVHTVKNMGTPSKTYMVRKPQSW